MVIYMPPFYPILMNWLLSHHVMLYIALNWLKLRSGCSDRVSGRRSRDFSLIKASDSLRVLNHENIFRSEHDVLFWQLQEAFMKRFYELNRMCVCVWVCKNVYLLKADGRHDSYWFREKCRNYWDPIGSVCVWGSDFSACLPV